MKSNINYIAICLFFLSLSLLHAEEYLHESDGILVNSDKNKGEGFYGLDFRSGLDILNQDGTVYGTLLTDMDNHEFSFIRSGEKVIPKIRGYYPDYHILIFDAKDKDKKGYQVYVDGEWKWINSDSRLTYKSWSKFLEEDASFIAFKDIQLIIYKNKGDNEGTVIKETESFSFKVIKVEGDWLFAICEKDCEGCELENKVIKGWFKWREGDRLLIDLRFIC